MLRKLPIALLISFILSSCAMNSTAPLNERQQRWPNSEKLVEAKALYESLPVILPANVRLNIAFIFLGQRSIFQYDDWQYTDKRWKDVIPELAKLALKYPTWFGFKQRIMPDDYSEKVKYLVYHVNHQAKFAPLFRDGEFFDDELFGKSLGDFYVCASDLGEIQNATLPLYQARIDVSKMNEEGNNHPIFAQMCSLPDLSPEKEVTMFNEFKHYSTLVRALDTELQPRFVLIYRRN